ncbi:MAG TPA: hypothetical protein VKE22_19950 [Haliangiales bacterium]|nr:hypothetical protein [Haliangiales bacterium]
MRPRWPEWVIAVALVALFVAGVAALWGKDIARLVGGDRPAKEAAPPAPPGPAAGPF